MFDLELDALEIETVLRETILPRKSYKMNSFVRTRTSCTSLSICVCLSLPPPPLSLSHDTHAVCVCVCCVCVCVCVCVCFHVETLARFMTFVARVNAYMCVRVHACAYVCT